MSPNKFYPEV